MPDAIAQYVRLIFPAGVCLVLLGASAVYFGADIPAAKAIFSSVVIAVAGLAFAVNPVFRPMPVLWGVLAVLLGFGVHHVLMGWMDTAAPEFAALAAAGCIWLMGYGCARQPDAGSALWRATLTVGSLIALWAFVSFTFEPRSPATARLSGGFLSANTAATFFGIIALMGLTELLGQIRKSLGSRPPAFARRAFPLALALVCVMISASCLVLTASRAGIAFAGLCAVALTGWQVLAWTRHGGVSQRSTGLGVAGIVAVFVIGGLVWTVSGELAGVRYESGLRENPRAELFAAYWEAVALAPLAGHGLGSFVFTNDLITTSQTIRSLGNTNAAHNVFLQWLLQAGWSGALAMWGVVLLLIWQVWRGLKLRRRHRGYLRAVLCISAFVTLHGLTDFALEVPGVMWWWAWILGLGAGIAAAGRREQTRQAGHGAARTGSPTAIASRAGFVTAAFVLAGLAGWQGQMRVSANLAGELAPEALAAVAQRDGLPPSAYLRDAYAARAIAADIGDLDFAHRATLAAIDREPRLVTAWNRLVYLDLVRNGYLTGAGQEALAQSYYLIPYGSRDVARWRLQIAASAWEQLTSLNRSGVRLELSAQAIRDRRWLQQFAAEVPDGFREEVEAVLSRAN
ncbi:O-antigen ligase family protein [Glycocaulis abyssi]|uniref:O-antigen ligase family protein n=1 Tax=Glycocaulis abyssi TaxID=1433403 RepID=A0ABV9NGV6_9PROT